MEKEREVIYQSSNIELELILQVLALKNFNMKLQGSYIMYFLKSFKNKMERRDN